MAFDRNDRVLTAPVSVAVVLVPDPSMLARQVAGVTVRSRQLIECARAGFTDACVAAGDDEALRAMVSADLARAGFDLAVRFQSVPGASERIGGVFVIRGAIIKAPALARLTRTDASAAALSLGGRIVARRLGGEMPADIAAETFWAPDTLTQAQVDALRPGEAIPLDSLAEATRMVLRETGKASDGLVSRHLNRPISRLLSGLLLRWDGLRPGHATVLTALTAAAMFFSLVHATPISLAIGCLLFHAASIVDGLDGEIARATFRSSAKGAALDTTVDMTSNLLFAIGLTIGLYRLYGESYLQLGVFSSVGLLAGIVSMALLVRRVPGGGSFDLLKTVYGARAAEGAGIGVVNAVRTATSRDFFAFLFACLGLIGMARAIPWILAFGVGLWLLVIAGGASIIFSGDDTDPAPR
jgi:CDP-L-myo-inositol myo-inositolphosphotransferase